jgi:hypothetical protein
LASEAWRLRGVSITYYQQKAALPGMKEAMPEDAEVNAQALQDVVLRVDRDFRAYFRRLKSGEKRVTPAFTAGVATTVLPIRSGGPWWRTPRQWVPCAGKTGPHRAALVSPA